MIQIFGRIIHRYDSDHVSRRTAKLRLPGGRNESNREAVKGKLKEGKKKETKRTTIENREGKPSSIGALPR